MSDFLTKKKVVGGFSALETVYRVGALTHWLKDTTNYGAITKQKADRATQGALSLPALKDGASRANSGDSADGQHP